MRHFVITITSTKSNIFVALYFFEIDIDRHKETNKL